MFDSDVCSCCRAQNAVYASDLKCGTGDNTYCASRVNPGSSGFLCIDQTAACMAAYCYKDSDCSSYGANWYCVNHFTQVSGCGNDDPSGNGGGICAHLDGECKNPGSPSRLFRRQGYGDVAKE